jgi:hypothetical protein
MIDQLFGVKLHTKLKCEETGEEYEVNSNMRASCAAAVHFGQFACGFKAAVAVAVAARAGWWLAG